ncbi:MAG: ParA family protein [Gammaproteobacteria bacterium]|nr:ParA family protein [Gammaproteobacteria bacterium]
MKVWAVANQKGGVGKTTTAITLAGLLARRGYSTLLVDMDPHGSLTSYLGQDPESDSRSLYTLFQRHGEIDPRDIITRTAFNRLWLMPASTALATLDRQSGVQDGMGLVLARALTRVSGSFDYVVLDCPPVLGVLMVNALAACDHLLIPVQTEFLAIKGLERMLSTLTMITRARRLPLPYTIVPTLFDRRTRAAHTSVHTLRERYPAQCWDSEIPVDTLLREASYRNTPLPFYVPEARACHAYGALLDMLQYADMGLQRKAG